MDSGGGRMVIVLTLLASCARGLDSNAYSTFGETIMGGCPIARGGSPTCSMHSHEGDTGGHVTQRDKGREGGIIASVPRPKPPSERRPTRGRTLSGWALASLMRRRGGHDGKVTGGCRGWSFWVCHGQDRAAWAGDPDSQGGGCQSRSFGHGRDEFARNQADSAPSALIAWGAWYGADSSKQSAKSVGGMYRGKRGCFRASQLRGAPQKVGDFQRVNGRAPYLDAAEDKFTTEEDIALSYVALSVGPLGKEVSTMGAHLAAIGYFHRVRNGVNPLTQMSRVQIMLKGLKRAKGPANRKLPFPHDDMMALKGLLNLQDVGQLIFWVSAMGWFSS